MFTAIIEVQKLIKFCVENFHVGDANNIEGSVEVSSQFYVKGESKISRLWLLLKSNI